MSESDMAQVDSSQTQLTPWWVFSTIGVLGGFLAGLFGVGGGLLMMPLLMIVAKMNQRVASGTSLAVIAPTALVGSISYALSGNVDWLAALVLTSGSIGGAQLGSYLLSKAPPNVLLWSFVTFQVAVIISMWIVVPDRSAALGWSPLVGIFLFFVGVFTGMLSGLLGAGGGIVLVPAMVVLFGVSDLVAKGTSLLAMVSGSTSGTVANIRRKNVDLRAASFTALGAVLVAPIGSLAANLVSARVGNILFTVLIGVTAARTVINHLRGVNANKEISTLNDST